MDVVVKPVGEIWSFLSVRGRGGVEGFETERAWFMKWNKYKRGLSWKKQYLQGFWKYNVFLFPEKLMSLLLPLIFFLSLLYMPYLAAGVGWEEYEANDLILPRGQI